ncbi:MAG TPA: HEAT repeat domain-containing protein, partial [Planctomycetota bacterium]|nr:HEAT repeat domain-containing protein [Planctomycetota bacterium]
LLGAEAVALLADLIEGDARETSISARHALTALVHHAGRPGADAERGPVLRELVRLVKSERSEFVRREALWLIGQIGGDAEAETVGSCLDDSGREIAQTARLVLERLPGKVAVRVLENAIVNAAAETRPDLIFSLGKKGDPDAAPFLLELASTAADEPVELAIFQALSRLGSADAIAPFDKAIDKAEGVHRAKLFDEYLRLAEERLEAGDDDAWRAMMRRALASAPLEQQRERALYRLCNPGNFAAIPDLLVGLNDAGRRVRRLALRRLQDLRGVTALEALREGYERAEPTVRPLILEALAEIDPESTKDLIQAALDGSEPDLRIAALALSGTVDPTFENEYLARARSDESLVRGLAFRAYVTLAATRLEEGARDAAFTMYSNAFEAAREPAERAEALRGLIRTNDPRALDQLQTVLADPAIGAEAAIGYVALSRVLIKSGEHEAAAKHLDVIVRGRFPLETVLDAAAALREIGRDPRKGALDRGFVLDWWLVGPIQDNNGRAMTTSFFPEERIQFEEIERIGPRRFRWKKLERLCLDGKVDLTVEFRRSQNVIAYAYSEIEVPEARDAVLRLGSDDGVVCWVNEKKVHEALGTRSYAVDQDAVPVHLEKGVNRILLKIGQGTGDWAFSLRVTDAGGDPLVLPK